MKSELSLLYLDRYRNEGTRNYSEHASYSEAEERYRPNSDCEDFDLEVFELPRQKMLCYTANPPEELENVYLSKESVLFCVHPQILQGCREEPYVLRTLSLGKARRGIRVIPSSSTRTLYVRDTDWPHAVKVHFPFRISRYGRKMRNDVLEQAISVSRELENGIDHLGTGFGFLREVIGVSHRNLFPDSPRGENWGYLIRDMRPFPRMEDPRDLVPGFALYGKDFFEPGRRPLLFDFMGKSDPLGFVLERIMIPIVRQWVNCFLHFGYLLEPHGQNVLFEIGRQREFKRIIHRDLSLGMDMRRRRDLGLSDKSCNSYNRMETGEFNSITYDKFMGCHFFDRIVSLCQSEYRNLDKEDFAQPCREEFQRSFPDHLKYFPRTVQYFSEERDQFNKPLFEDTGRPPEWRP